MNQVYCFYEFYWDPKLTFVSNIPSVLNLAKSLKMGKNAEVSQSSTVKWFFCKGERELSPSLLLLSRHEISIFQNLCPVKL